MLSLLIAVVLVALVFDYINGFHDAANAIATSVSTGVLPMRTSVFIAAIFNFVGALMGTEVAKTISGGIVDSFSMVSLKRFLENKYKISIPDEKATPEAFDSVTKIVSLVREYVK